MIGRPFPNLANNPSRAVTYECLVHDRDGQWCWMEVEMTDMLDDPDIQAIVLNNRRAVTPRPGNERLSTSVTVISAARHGNSG